MEVQPRQPHLAAQLAGFLTQALDHQRGRDLGVAPDVAVWFKGSG